MQLYAQAENAKVTLSSSSSLFPRAWPGRSAATKKMAFRRVEGSILLYLSFQKRDRGQKERQADVSQSEERMNVVLASSLEDAQLKHCDQPADASSKLGCLRRG